MKDSFTLSNLEQVKVLAVPLRVRILETLQNRPMTTKQVAESLGEGVTKLYHHMAALEQAGLVELVETRRNRGAVEKYYRPAAKQFIVDRKLLAGDQATGEVVSQLQAMFGSLLDETGDEIRRSIAEKLMTPESTLNCGFLGRARLRGSPERVEALLGKLQSLLAECNDAPADEGEIEYGLTVVFYPVRRMEERDGRK